MIANSAAGYLLGVKGVSHLQIIFVGNGPQLSVDLGEAFRHFTGVGPDLTAAVLQCCVGSCDLSDMTGRGSRNKFAW